MRNASKIAVTITLAVALMTGTAGCSLLPIVAQQDDSTPTETEEAPAATDEALNSYVEAERAQIPTIIEQYPDLYSDVSIAGAVEESTGDEENIPAGPHSTIRFTYTYTAEMDWEATGPALDAQGSALEDACSGTIFPAMRTYGVEGPLAAVFEYTDAANASETMWSYACSDEG